MGKIFAGISLFFIIQSAAFAQHNEMAYGKKQSTISAGYGIGNVWKRLFNFYSPISGSDYKVSSTGPFSLVYEYGFTHRISGGIALGYSKIKAILTYQQSKNIETLSNFSALARGNYHFLKSPKWDPYAGLGVGSFKFNYTSKDASGNGNAGTGVKVPGVLGFSGQIGAKYYVSKSFGAYAEVGYVAGSVGQVGINYRF